MSDAIRPAFRRVIEAEATRDALLAARAAVEGLASGWTRPEDQHGPKQHEWVYKASVFAAIDALIAEAAE